MRTRAAPTAVADLAPRSRDLVRVVRSRAARQSMVWERPWSAARAAAVVGTPDAMSEFRGPRTLGTLRAGAPQSAARRRPGLGCSVRFNKASQ